MLAPVALLERKKQSKRGIYAPYRFDYANFDVHVRDSFDWWAILEQLHVPIGKTVVLYAFRSIQKPDADVERLTILDEIAWRAAKKAPGFIHYEPQEGLSYCLWESVEAARAGILTPEHMAAAGYAKEAYEEMELLCWSIGASMLSGEVEFTEIPRTETPRNQPVQKAA